MTGGRNSSAAINMAKPANRLVVAIPIAAISSMLKRQYITSSEINLRILASLVLNWFRAPLPALSAI
ncbi:hypothetical protein PPUN109347_36920 [Pseudomonas putida]|nr:hypothetical protein PPUN109347_36920 [Pseudomonas putida]